MVATQSGHERSDWLRKAAGRLAVAIGAKALWVLIVKLFDRAGVDA
ncbi:hypothetical protein FHS42_004958 [Streptomyces zagrosensis]|uniref:Uncharacterized protein n=1 Tax=Streptomyces zagrosensis TaxID=1042984 RepID=A0A7W9V1K2_9ACTN|nr:hypothetical protein [Streptomyces zagrosensis]